MEAARPLLELRSISLKFGGVQALDGVTFSIPERSRSGLIGPNGAGKTTLFNCISRLVHPQSGRIMFAGRDLTTAPAHVIHGIGIARTFQGIGLVPTMTVLENVMIGAGQASQHGFARTAATLWEMSRLERKVRHRAIEMLERLRLDPFAQHTPPELPFGTQKRVELARALMSEPTLLMLDEPANGLTASEVEELRELLLDLWRTSAMTLFIVEHHMGLVMSVCEDIIVLDAGRLLARGRPEAVRDDPKVIRAYLGTREKATRA